MWMVWVGYTASVLVAISLWTSNIWKFRWINLAGSMVFVVYGLSIGAYPVAAMNTICCGLNVYYIVQMANRKEYFSYLIAEDVNSAFIRYFIRFYEQDMRKFFPEFSEKTLNGEQVRVIVVLRNAAPVGLFMYHKMDEHSAMIDLDYAVPEYRDLENIRFLLREGLAERFEQENIQSFVVKSRVPAHVHYLRKLGFESCAEQADFYRMSL